MLIGQGHSSRPSGPSNGAVPDLASFHTDKKLQESFHLITPKGLCLEYRYAHGYGS